MTDSLNTVSPEEKFKITDFQTLRSDIVNMNSTLSTLFPSSEEFIFDSSSNLYYLNSSVISPSIRGLYRLDSAQFSNNTDAVDVLDVSCAADVDRKLSTEQVSIVISRTVAVRSFHNLCSPY